ncbi:MAG: hypothetical protein J6C22_18165 [Bacteroides sp.]|nr:hypothetical protein [Bacteroides sp.]
MKKCIIVLCCIFVLGMIGCGQKKGPCKNCGEEGLLYVVTTTNPILDKTYIDEDMCENCVQAMQDFVNDLNELGLNQEIKVEEMKK